MTIADPFAKVLPAWIEAHDMDNGADSIAIMSGVRIRRNIDGFAFPGRCEKSELYDLAALVLGVIGRSDGWECFDFRMMDSLDNTSRNILLESRMITPVLAQGGPGRFLMRDGDGEIVCMINEEDHLLLSVTRPGVDLGFALDRAESLVGALDIKFTRDSVLGYLTANPSHVGTGVKSFVLLHLPALDALGEMPRVCDSFIRDWKKLALYRFLSDKNNECGSFFLLSNKVTLATTPDEIAGGVADAAQSLASKELFARHKIRASRNVEIDDRLWRAWGVLRHARKLSFNEAINMFSLVKLGSDMGILPHIYNREWKKMVLGTHQYHLALASQGIIREQSEEARVRAARFRQFMEKKSSATSFESGLG
jgi:protein arginine kinase